MLATFLAAARRTLPHHLSALQITFLAAYSNFTRILAAFALPHGSARLVLPTVLTVHRVTFTMPDIVLLFRGFDATRRERQYYEK